MLFRSSILARLVRSCPKYTQDGRWPRSVSEITRSNHEVGTTYEHLALQSLRSLCFDLYHTGGRADRGIDLLGHWSPPRFAKATQRQPLLVNSSKEKAVPNARPVPVIVQCKAHATSPLPSWIRELEGSFNGAPMEWQIPDAIGVLVAKGKATEGVRQSVMSAQRGTIWIQLLEGHDKGIIGQVLWNAKVKALVGSDLATGLTYSPGQMNQGLRKEVRLMWQGRLWEPDIEADTK